MEMELMLKESVTGSNKSKRERAVVSDRKSWTKTGLELEADMEGGEGIWKLSTRTSDWGQEVWTLTKGHAEGRQATPLSYHHSSEDKPPYCRLCWD